jgi:adenylate cyclase
LAVASAEQPTPPFDEATPELVRSARAAKGAAEADRRPVTVLFADLSGFTALNERLDPEEVRSFQSDMFQEMAAVIQRYEGFVEKFVGDAIMAVFGAPVAHEDDPERMAELNRRWEHRLGTPLALHIGVNTGPVVAGTLGLTSGATYAVTGDTVNTASRLQGAAPAGTDARRCYNL